MGTERDMRRGQQTEDWTLNEKMSSKVPAAVDCNSKNTRESAIFSQMRRMSWILKSIDSGPSNDFALELVAQLWVVCIKFL